MRAKRAALQRRYDTALAASDAATAEAARAGAAGQKQMALAALTRRRAHAAEAKQMAAMLATLDQQLAVIDTTVLSASVAASMRDGADVMASVHTELDVAGIEQSMVDIRLRAREADHVTRLLTRPLLDTDEVDDAALAAELDAVLATAATPVAAVPVTPPVRVAAPAAPKTVREAEKDFGL